MLNELIGSKMRVNILKLFVFNPKQEYYPRQLERLVKKNYEHIRKELIKLETIGLLKSRVSGKQKYYCLNTEHTLYPDIKSIILKTVGIGDVLKAKFAELKDILICFIYGSYAKNVENIDSDIDLFIIGNVQLKELQKVLSGIEADIKREMNPTVYSKAEFRNKYKSNHRFIKSVINGPKLFIKGNSHVLRKLV